MAILLLLAQLVALPVTSAYAQQIKKDVVVAVTYTDTVPLQVCSFAYESDDEQMRNPIGEPHCVAKPSPVGDFIVWRNERLDLVNLEVIVRYPGGKTERIRLATRLDT